MSSAKKLQGEIDRVLKAVAEGQEVFEEIWQKVHEASTAAQKEKFEGELKTQIKKLQRLREQIKSWITGDQVKDKQPLMDARKRIESDMERFKICEKETKTKAYSKDGLAAANNNDPETRARMEAREWVENCLDQLQTQKDAHEAEIEVIRSKQKKNSKVSERETELNEFIERHSYHVERLELILRLLDNENLTVEDVNSIKDDVDYYITSNTDPDFQEDDTIYDALNLDELDQGGLDVLKTTKKEKEAEKERREKEEQEREEARRREEARKAEMEKKRKAEEERKAKEEQRRQLEAERRRQEEERRRQMEQHRRNQEQQRLAQEAQRQQELAAQAGAGAQAGAAAGAAGAKKLSEAAAAPAKGGAASAAASMPVQQPQQPQQQAAQAKGQVPHKSFLSQLRTESGKDDAVPAEGGASQSSADLQLSQGEAGLSQDNLVGAVGGVDLGLPEGVDAHGPPEDQADRLSMLEASMKFMPEMVETDRPKPLFDNPQVFDKLDMDTLFFIFYFQTGTLQQYLAARELKKQGWRFHKKYLTWFQRHEEPVETGHQGERGTYVYFDYETGWCQRIKTDFTFDYFYLEDEVPAQ